jgi:hypothetical protein
MRSAFFYRRYVAVVVPDMAFFTFPEDAHWNADLSAVEFGVSVGEYDGIVRVPRRTFQRILDESPTPERCVAAYYLNRTRFERIAERKLRRRQLTEDANVVRARRSAGVVHVARWPILGPASADAGRGSLDFG